MNISMIKHASQLSYRVPYVRTASNRFILSYSEPFLEKKIFTEIPIQLHEYFND